MKGMQGSAETILIVDDNPTNLGVLFNALSQRGFKVLVAEDGERALHQLERVHPQLILLDVLMPGMDGFETCRRIKALDAGKEIPVIFMTALAEVVDKLKGFEAGGVDYITKPLQHEEVLARVSVHLTIRQLRRQLEVQNVLLAQQNQLLEEKNRQLEELNASKDKFFSIIAHDLRSPFTGFLGLTQFIVENVEEWSKEKIKELTQKLHEAAENLYALLGNLLTWSRIQRGLVEYTPMVLPAYEIVARNLTLFAANARQKNITFNNTVTPDAPIYADPQMADTIIRNILSNAVKFTNPGGSVSVQSDQRGPQTAITITDTGIGIPEEKLGQLFRIDAKYKRSGTAGEQGTGLGLILCKELVEKNGGTLEVKSVLERGTSFIVTFPQHAPVFPQE